MVENGVLEQPKGVSRNRPRAQSNDHPVSSFFQDAYGNFFMI
jgi:hypothetical protein